MNKSLKRSESGINVRSAQNLLVKDHLAAVFREEIISGRLGPGEPIVEGRWAARLKVAQASIREALNKLALEGFIQRGTNRSVTVTELGDEDVVHTLEVRAALESLAARLVAEKKPDLSEMEQTIADMRSASACKNMRAFYDRDIQFHLLLCEKSGNSFLLEHVKRLVIQLFAFVVVRRGGAYEQSRRLESERGGTSADIRGPSNRRSSICRGSHGLCDSKIRPRHLQSLEAREYL